MHEKSKAIDISSLLVIAYMNCVVVCDVNRQKSYEYLDCILFA